MQKWLINGMDQIKDSIAQGIVEGLKKALIWVLTSIADGSYWICLIFALICLILYVTGAKKAGKYVGISFIVFYILQCIKAVL